MSKFLVSTSLLVLAFCSSSAFAADFPDFATFLVEQGIDSISLVSDTVVKTRLAIAAKERELGITP